MTPRPNPPTARRLFLPAVCALIALLAGPRAGAAAGPDNNVEWPGLSHVGFEDRRPLCPVGGETFQVRLQALKNDLTGARVRVDTGVVTFVNASVVGARGPYDIWAAQVPASPAGSTINYMFEVTDGADVDYYSVNGASDLLPADGGFVINFANLSHAPVGATLVNNGAGAVFKVWAPTRTSALVRGTFNGWGTTNPLTKVGEYFIGRVNSATDLAYYKFFFNNATWNSDPRARSLDPTNSYNARIENPLRYNWQVPDFPTPALDRMVVYQLHVGTFSGRNDPVGTPSFPGRFVDVAARVNHLVELGVNAVMVMPVCEFPTDISAGYNPITAWAPEWRYGTPDEFKQMVDTLHQHGIAVIVDIVWNHLSPTDNYLWNYDGSQSYFDTPVVDTPWGSQAAFGVNEVRDYYVNSAQQWLEEFKVDGFRMDATAYMDQGAHAATGYSLMQRFNDALDNRWADKVTIAEELPNDPYITRPTSLGGAGFDAQYYDYFTDNLRQEIQDAAFGSPEMFKIATMINGSGTYLNNHNVFNYFELHDEIWPSNGGQRMVVTIDPSIPHDDIYARGRSTLAMGIVLLAPGVPAFHQGTEWLEDTGFGADAANRIDWSKKTTYAGVFHYYQDLIRLRTTNDALRADAAHLVFKTDEAQDLIAFDRSGGGELLTVVANFSNTTRTGYRVGLAQPGSWQEVLNSQSSLYGGSGQENGGLLTAAAVAADGRAQSLVLTVPAMSVLVLRHVDGQSGVGEVLPPTPANELIERVWPNPLAGGAARIAFRVPEAGAVRLSVLDSRGRLVVALPAERLAAGRYERSWNGTDGTGRRLPAGVYFLRVETAGGSAARKVILAR